MRKFFGIKFLFIRIPEKKLIIKTVNSQKLLLHNSAVNMRLNTEKKIFNDFGKYFFSENCVFVTGNEFC